MLGRGNHNGGAPVVETFAEKTSNFYGKIFVAAIKGNGMLGGEIE